MATYSEDDLELSLAKIAIVALILLWIALPFLISELQAEELVIDRSLDHHKKAWCVHLYLDS